MYFLHEEDQPSVMRMRIRDRKLERVADLKNFRQAGFWSSWLGMAPESIPSSASGHRHPGYLRSRLAGAIIPARRSATARSKNW